MRPPPGSPLTPVHHPPGERSAGCPVHAPPPGDTSRRVPVSLQQPLLTEETLQKMPVTTIDKSEREDPALGAPSQAMVPVSDTGGLLFPAGLASLFCRTGQAGVVPDVSTEPVFPNGTDLHRYPRELLTIVSSLRGPVSVGPARTEADGAVASPEVATEPPQHRPEQGSVAAVDKAGGPRLPWENSVIVASAGHRNDTGVEASEEIQKVEVVAVAASVPQQLAQPARSVPDLATSSASNVVSATGGSTSTTARPFAPCQPELSAPPLLVATAPARATEGGADDESGRSDTSTVTAEFNADDVALTSAPGDDEDDRMSVVSTGSTWSDISGFEEDIWRLRSVLRDPTAPPEPAPTHLSQKAPRNASLSAAPPQQPVTEQQQLQVHRLQLQLQHASQERDLYRGQLEALQGQMTAGSQRQHFEVRRQKAHLEGLLEMTRKELEEVVAERADLRVQLNRCQLEVHAASSGAVRNERDALLAELTPLRARARDCDAQLSETQAKLETREAELTSVRDELRQTEKDVSSARLALEQARREAESRDSTVAALKAKVAELVVDAQQGLQERLQADNAVAALREELSQRERSRDWYRGQLKMSQDERLQQQQALMAAQTELIAQKNAGERLRGELSLAQQAAAAAQTRAVREKDSLLRHLENIRADMLQREALFKTMRQQQRPQESALSRSAVTAASLRELDAANAAARSLELKVQELQQQLEKAEESVAAADSARLQQDKLHQQTQFALIAGQEKLSQQNKLFETLKQRSDESIQELDLLRTQLKESATARQQLQDEKTRLEVALASANQEKRDVDDAARDLSAELKKVSASFYKLKNEVSSKEKQIEELREGLATRDSELRSTNDRLNEAGKLKLQADQVSEKMQIFDSMNEQNKQLMVANHELRYKTQQLTQDRAVLDQGRQRLEEVVRSLQQQVNESVQREAEVKTALDQRIAAVRELEEQKHRGKQELAAVKAYARKLHHREGSPGVVEERVETSEIMSKCEKSVSLQSSHVEKAAVHKIQRVDSADRDAIPSQVEGAGTGDRPAETVEDMSHQISLLALQNRELERRLASVSSPSSHVPDSDSSAERVGSLLQENASLTSQLASLTSQVQRLETDAENYRRAAAARRTEEDGQAATIQQLREQLQLSQTRNKQLQQQLAAARRPSAEPGLALTHGSDTSQPASQQESPEAEACRRLSDELAATKAGYKEKHRCYQSNIRVLTRKLREYMRALKTAERQLAAARVEGAAPEEVTERTVELEEAAAQQRRRLEAAQRETARAQQEAEQLRTRADGAQLLALELEKERGRLEGMAQSYSALQRRAAELEALLAGYEEQRQTQREQTPAQQRQLQQQLQQLQQRLQQEQLDAKELRRQLFGERREVSRLKKEAVSLQSGLQTAEDVAQVRQAQAGEAQAALETARRDLAETRSQASEQRAALETAQRQMAEARRQAEQSAANEPALAQQIKTLSGHLQQKNAELRGLQEQAQLMGQRHLAELDGLRASLRSTSEELHQLRTRLDATRQEKFSLQTQTTELRTALQASAEQARELRAQVAALEARLTSSERGLSLPAPSPVDEALIARLLEQSEPAAAPRPLDDLQACLHSLKQEMSALQTQIHQTEPWASPPLEAGVNGASLSPTPASSVTSPGRPSASLPSTVTSPERENPTPTDHVASPAPDTLAVLDVPATSDDDVTPAAPEAPPATAAAGSTPPASAEETSAAVDRFLKNTHLEQHADVEATEADADITSDRLRSYFVTQSERETVV